MGPLSYGHWFFLSLLFLPCPFLGVHCVQVTHCPGAKPTPTACSRVPALTSPWVAVTSAPKGLSSSCPGAALPWGFLFARGSELVCEHGGFFAPAPALTDTTQVAGLWACGLLYQAPRILGSFSHIQTSCSRLPSSPPRWRPQGHTTDSWCWSGGQHICGEGLPPSDWKLNFG